MITVYCYIIFRYLAENLIGGNTRHTLKAIEQRASTPPPFNLGLTIMQEPATTSAFLAVMCTIGVVSGADAYPVIISSFAGATLYMTSNRNIGLARRWLYFILSFLIGITTSGAVGKLISSLVPFVQLNVDQSLGALISSAFVIKILVSLLENKEIEESFIKKIIRWLSKKGGE